MTILMKHPRGSVAPGQSDDQDGTFRSVVADLIGLVERIQRSLELVETAIVVEMSAGKEDMSAAVVVLDDVTPGYLKAGAALQACGAGLGLALHLLQAPTRAGVARACCK